VHIEFLVEDSSGKTLLVLRPAAPRRRSRLQRVVAGRDREVRSRADRAGESSQAKGPPAARASFCFLELMNGNFGIVRSELRPYKRGHGL
jgi:hypothetical protein